MWESILYQLNPFQQNISYEDQQKYLLHLIIVILVITICLENIVFSFFIFLIIIYFSINKMNTFEHYTNKSLSPQDAAVQYTSIQQSNNPTSVNAAQLHTLQQTNTTCSAENAKKELREIAAHKDTQQPISYSSSQKAYDELATLINMYPCLTDADQKQCVKRINEISSQLQSFIEKNNPDPVDPEYKIVCKNENAIYFDHNEIATDCPFQKNRPIFPDPAINPQAKVATNRLVKPYSATIFTQMEKNKNIGRTYDKPTNQHCPRYCPQVKISPKLYNKQIYPDLNNNIKTNCFKKDFPYVNPTERNLSLNPNTFYKNFIDYKPTTMGQRLQIETAIRREGTKVFDQMNDSVIDSLPPVKQNKLCGYNQ